MSGEDGSFVPPPPPPPPPIGFEGVQAFGSSVFNLPLPPPPPTGNSGDNIEMNGNLPHNDHAEDAGPVLTEDGVAEDDVDLNMDNDEQKPQESPPPIYANTDFPDGQTPPTTALFGSNDSGPNTSVGMLLTSYDDMKERDKFKETLFFLNDPGQKRIDYVLCYQHLDDEHKIVKRTNFETNLQDAGLEIEVEDKSKSVDHKTNYLKLHATWDALASGAELMSMKKRIKMPKELEEDTIGCCSLTCGTTEDDVVPDEDEFFTAPFLKDRLNMFEVDPTDPDSIEHFFTNAERSLIVKEILDRTSYTSEETDTKRFGISRLLRDGVFTAAFPLHEGQPKPNYNDRDRWKGDDKDRQRLWESWARPGRFLSPQPLDLVRKYFGEKIAIYFAWLGFYTAMLIPASIAGVAVFIYGIVTLGADQPSRDICRDSDPDDPGTFVMCPKCDIQCRYTQLNESCLYAQVTYVFDNYGTVAMAAFMAIWSTLFLEFWKRKQKEIGYEWDVAEFELEERMRPEFELKVKKKRPNPITNTLEPYIPWYNKAPRLCTAWVVILFMILLVLAAIFGVIVYRMVIVYTIYAINASDTINTYVKEYAKIITSITAALINLIIIVILNIVYKFIAQAITVWETHRTETEYEDSFTFKMFLFQFVNFYGSTFYIAFFKGSFVDRPGSTNMYFLGKYRQDECDPAGCMVDLFINLAIIMVGKQVMNNAKEILLPFFKTYCRTKGSKKKETEENIYMRWEQDKDLEILPKLGLFEEYLEMVIQFGFVTIFVAAFPLAPFFALLNNVIEIRLDAYKFLVIWQRPPAQRAQDIGVWYDCLTGISFIAVLSNAFIIAWTSEFVPKLVYLWKHDQVGLDGYVNASLAYFSISDFTNSTGPDSEHNNLADLGNATVCRYKGWREAENPYDYTRMYWEIFTARLCFVIVFEHACFFLTWLISYLIPDVPANVKQLMLYEKQLTKKMNFEHAFGGSEARKRRTSGYGGGQ